MKDNFSQQASLYAEFRPSYPREMVDFILKHVVSRTKAWDCATGNGQMAAALSPHFKEIIATDVSEQQIRNATQQGNIKYKIERAECTSLPNHSIDLITVAQAIHWFEFEKFYPEVDRVLKPQGIIGVIGYSKFRINQQVDEIIDYFYKDVVGPYWDQERRYVEEGYETIPFPFKEIPTPRLRMDYKWTLDQLLGYLSTWSAVARYQHHHRKNPIDQIKDSLKKVWGIKVETKEVRFPLLLRIGTKA